MYPGRKQQYPECLVKYDGITEEHGPCENKHRIYSNTLMSWLFAVSECQYEACNKS